MGYKNRTAFGLEIRTNLSAHGFLRTDWLLMFEDLESPDLECVQVYVDGNWRVARLIRRTWR
ncbi:hypothetical protein RhiirA5_428619 [Rhizophagus irregularis]|uniref:Uncharacterized protein n=1 Tax=Rhizophagus irregularis TaxID=588596 RepID=A0A2N0P000_9GLOM|nr:hypothetical protein RhiirA5_428619 [Rhizophagus irregularis]